MTDPAVPLASDVPIGSAPPFRGNLVRIDQGEWAGWYQWGGIDPFETANGQFYVARDDQGIVCGFRPGAHHRNGHGMIHGGALMTFADFSLFMIGGSAGEEVHGVTVTMNCEFLGPAQAGHLLLVRGERTGGGRSLMFARGIMTSNGRPALGFSGTIKVIRGT